MIDELRTKKVNDNFHIHLIQSSKFKTDLLSLYFLRPLTLEETTLNALLTRVIDRGTQKYPTSQLINQHLDDLYGTSMICDVMKIGERQQVQIKVQYPRSPIIDRNLMEEALDFLEEMVYNPLLIEGKFDESIFEMEKSLLKQEIESRTNDKTSYAMDRAIELMCSEEPYRFYTYGDIDYLETITNEQLYKHYLDVIQHSKMDVVAIGDFDFDTMEETIVRHLREPKGDVVVVPEEIVKPATEPLRIINETMNLQQARLVVGCRTNTDRFDAAYYPLQLFGMIYGGTPSSKLFMTLRERDSLCYYVGTKVDKLKGIMYTIAGIDEANYERSLQVMDEEFEKMLNGEIGEEELEIAKKAIIASLQSISDFPNTFSNFCNNQFMLGDSLDIEYYIECYERVTLSEVIEIGKRIQKDMIYMLKGSEATC